MAKLNLRTARRIKTSAGEVLRLKGQGFEWERPPWTPADLFRNGEQGAWYDPSDLSTLFQDAAGTEPVTAPGQPVGLMLDKRFGLAREDITLGEWTNHSFEEFSANGQSLSVNKTVSGGNRYALIGTPFTGTLGDSYEVEVVFTSTVGGGISFGAVTNGRSNFVNIPSGASSVRGVLTINTVTPNTTLRFHQASNGVTVIDSVVLRKLPGNHVMQTTTAARPLYQVEPDGLAVLDFDGVDDTLESTSLLDYNMSDGATFAAAYSPSFTPGATSETGVLRLYGGGVSFIDLGQRADHETSTRAAGLRTRSGNVILSLSIPGPGLENRTILFGLLTSGSNEVFRDDQPPASGTYEGDSSFQNGKIQLSVLRKLKVSNALLINRPLTSGEIAQYKGVNS